MLFFRNSLFRVGFKWIRTIIFFFSYSQPVLSRFGFKRSHNHIILVFSIFLLFFWNSLFRVGLEWIGTITFFLYHSQPVPYRFGLKWSHNDVFQIFAFFCYFLGIPYSRWVGINWNDNFFFFFFVSLSSCPIPFWLEMKPQRCFLIFCITLLFFWNSLFWIGFEWIETITFFYYILFLAVMRIFKFLHFLQFFGNSLFWIGLEWIGMITFFLFFVSLSACPVPFWLEMKPEWCFLIFCISLLFVWNSLFRVGLEWTGMITFFFVSLSTYPVLF